MRPAGKECTGKRLGSESAILTVEDLSVTLDDLHVLRNVSFTVTQTEALAVMTG
jgi:ABC-type transporter Mla maintaining outer membrane lipid asymmetry ATPase subunit MlaF